jgi:aspartyl-tRNA(Asn)/glutamyl-tRNA(Gln) amidotransferase subunit B
LRCDANISVRLKGAPEFGTKVEVKNMNSIRNVQKAIEFEIARQIEAVEKGETISQETRSFDALKGITISMRSKEAANDYRYFPEPDLPPIHVSLSQIEAIKKEMPLLPKDLYKKYTEQLGLSAYDANNIIDQKAIALYYENLIQHTSNFKSAANWIMGDIKSYLNQNGVEIEDFPLKPLQIAKLIALIEEGLVSNSVASQKIFPVMVENPDKEPLKIAEELNLIQEKDENSILAFIQKVIELNPNEVERFKNGEHQLIGFFMGQLMKVSNGKADPKAANALLRKHLLEA